MREGGDPTFPSKHAIFISLGIQDYVWLAVYVTYQIVFLVLPIKVLNSNNLPPASAVIIVCEQVRSRSRSQIRSLKVKATVKVI